MEPENDGRPDAARQEPARQEAARPDAAAGRGPGARLLGRRAERAVLDRLLTDVRRGESRTLVLRGGAGVGKTALLEHAVAAAPELHVLRAVGVQSEMELAFAALHQLCLPILDRVDRIPEPQGRALATVFGMATGPAPDRFMVGLAVLSLISDLAEEQPVLAVVDDAQWLDAATAQSLGFVARRTGAEAVGLLFGAREVGVELEGLPELAVDGLPDEDARALLGSAVEFVLDRPVRDRIVAETGGNPLALLELPRGLTATELAAGLGLPGGQGIPGRIEQSFLRQADTLPEPTRQLLLVAAAEPVGDPVVVRRAADQLGIGAAFEEVDGLLRLGERVTFRHPLVRSAVYGAAPAEDRRAVHLALALATDTAADPDRRAWHLAAAATGPNEEVAVELERCADRAQARGGFAAAAAFLQRAVALTRDPVRRTDRALTGAHACLQAGAFSTALGLLATAEAGHLDELGRARVDLLRAEAAFAQRRGRDAPGLLLRAAQTLEPLDTRLARDTYLDAWSAALFAGRLAGPVGLHEVSRAATTVRPTEETRSSDVLLDGLALLFTEGRERAVPMLKRAAGEFGGAEISAEEVLRWGWLATAAAAAAWDFEACLATATRQVEVARSAGALAVLAVGVNVLGQVVALTGDFAEATSLRAEADAVREATGTHVAPYGALVLAAYRGRPDEAFPLIDDTIARATVEGQGTAVQYARWTKAVVLNALGRHDDALLWATTAAEDTPELFVSSWALGELVEAAVRCRRPREAADALTALQRKTRDSDERWGLGLEARARALVQNDDAGAETAYVEAIEVLGQTRLRPELARAHLVYGEWLRRQGRRADARAELRAAHDLFAAIGMEAFVERTRRELQVAGETVRRRAVTESAGGLLTPQERQIAFLVRDGLSNPEVGTRLFLSPRTVEWHLRKIFDKLSISSRRQLRDALPHTEYEAATG
ncbi:helix-turn-helix transcriptional regulator [Kribbella sp. CA-247076]|uniref:helix-turn-helix transcriptional regulator n=1 Tax=Kribbella sp. CA-247076 TaxID=3239941 RepID=UPI003D89CFD4